jgi:ubiquinone/menaquinone biosynthesis C-methylase UbiE
VVQADATSLPLGDKTFEAVICQFGVMFFPDKRAAFREAHRVLAPGGLFLFNVWDALDRNPLAGGAPSAGQPPSLPSARFLRDSLRLS